MPLTRLRQLARCSVIFASALLLAACQATGSGTNVACESIGFVYVSHKDTNLTITQNGENNEALASLCGRPKKIGKKK